LVNYFTINLNKAANRLDIYEQKRKRVRIFYAGIYSLVVFILAAAALYFTFLTDQRIKEKKETIDQLQAQIEALEASETYISKEDVYSLVDLADRRVDWSLNLIWLARALPKDIAITELDFNNNMLIIKGISKVKAHQKDLDRVMDIIDRIQFTAEPYSDFEAMKFKFTNRIKHLDQEILSFEISCPIS
jgi:Tfp pilus assembly protein PilN